MSKFISRILIANRGEIARRIIRTTHTMGIGSVAIYADGDAGEPFVQEADQAIALGGNSSRKTYLDFGEFQRVPDLFVSTKNIFCLSLGGF